MKRGKGKGFVRSKIRVRKPTDEIVLDVLRARQAKSMGAQTDVRHYIQSASPEVSRELGRLLKRSVE